MDPRLLKPLEKYTQEEVHRMFEDARYTIPCPPALKAAGKEAGPKSIVLSGLPLAKWVEAANKNSQRWCMIHAPASLSGLKLIDQHTTKERCDECECRAMVCRPAEKEAEAKSIVPTRYEPRAERPLWQMDLRHKLGLEPGMCDPVSRMLMGAVYDAEDENHFEELMADHIAHLVKAVEKARAK